MTTPQAGALSAMTVAIADAFGDRAAVVVAVQIEAAEAVATRQAWLSIQEMLIDLETTALAGKAGGHTDAGAKSGSIP